VKSSELIGWFADIGLADRPSVGGKGGSLGELTRAGIRVPPGFVVRTAAFNRFLEALEHEAPIREAVEKLDPADLDATTACSVMLCARITDAALPEDIAAEVGEAHRALVGESRIPIAVRSSATTEDAEDASFAGLQDTYLWVKGVPDTLRLLKSCWASLYSVPSISYRRKHGMEETGVAMAVVMQRMVNARSAGVMFTRSPTTGDRSVITIEGSWGLGSAVVSGEVTPDRFVVNKITGQVTAREISEKLMEHLPAQEGGIRDVSVADERKSQPSITDDELAALVAIGKRVEKHYGRPQDIEWAIDRESGDIFLLQSRPETVWSSRDRAPIARPAERPVDHILQLFTGRK